MTTRTPALNLAPRTPARDATAAAHDTVTALLAVLGDHVDRLANTDAPNYGHVGTLDHIANVLTDLLSE